MTHSGVKKWGAIMEEMIPEFAEWLVKFLVIYAVVFLFVKKVLRRYIFPRKPPSASAPEAAEHADKPPQ